MRQVVVQIDGKSADPEYQAVADMIGAVLDGIHNKDATMTIVESAIADLVPAVAAMKNAGVDAMKAVNQSTLLARVDASFVKG